jgi:hypothetical protein
MWESDGRGQAVPSTKIASFNSHQILHVTGLSPKE